MFAYKRKQKAVQSESMREDYYSDDMPKMTDLAIFADFSELKTGQ